jgi:hypothetical protein
MACVVPAEGQQLGLAAGEQPRAAAAAGPAAGVRVGAISQLICVITYENHAQPKANKEADTKIHNQLLVRDSPAGLLAAL